MKSGRDARYYSVNGDEIGSGALGEICPQLMACCAINLAMYRAIGPFDQTFAPTYYEDCDYFYRMRLLGFDVTHDFRSLCVHERNKSTLTDAQLSSELPTILETNKRRYVEKWGGEPHHESYTAPFDGGDRPPHPAAG